MLIPVKMLKYRVGGYAPTRQEAYVNTDFIVSITPVETRCTEPCVSILLAGGEKIECVGKPEDFNTVNE